MRSNGANPYLIARGVHGCAGGATGEVGGENCARGATAEGRVGRSSAEDCMGTRGRAGIIEGAFERQSAVDMRMQRERMRTVLSSTRRV